MHAMRPRAVWGSGTSSESSTVDLTDDRVLGAHGPGNRGDRGGDRGLTPMRVDRPQRGRRLGHRQLGCGREKLCDSIELTVIDIGRIPVHQVAQGRPVG